MRPRLRWRAKQVTHRRELRRLRVTHAGYNFAYDESRAEFFLRFGSAGVMIQVLEHEDGDLVLLHSPLLFDLEAANRADILEQVNRLNCEYLFGAFCYYDGSDGQQSWNHIRLEHHMLAEHLQAEELLHALGLISQMVEDEDDKVQAALGAGKRAVDYWNWTDSSDELASH